MSAPAEAGLLLASRSPRRRAMLDAAGIAHAVRPAGIDDGTLVPGRVDPGAWTAALAYLKARWVCEHAPPESGLVLGADTVCVGADGAILGQPASADEAGAMLRSFRNVAHRVISGAALVRPRDRARRLLVDVAVVRWGDVPDRAIDDYVASEDWQGKAGGYNLAERVAAGWPIACAGDPDTVMGLPMRRLPAWLASAFGAAPDAAPGESAS